MNPVQVHRELPNYYFENDHTEGLARIASAITMFDPVKTAIGYLVPWMGAWTSNQTQLRKDDRAQERLLNSQAKDVAFQVIKDLKSAAEIDREISLYTSLDYRCLSYGGTCSFSSPIISVPLYFLTKNGVSTFDEVEVQEPFDQPPDHWTFSADEVTFFMAREMSHINSNDALLRIASKVLFVAAIFFFYTMATTALFSASLILVAGVLYLISERFIHAKLDIKAVNILTKYFEGDQNRAIKAATSALQKLMDQNIERKERKNWWNGFYLTSAGNNVLDLDHPFLTNRLERLQGQFNIAAPAELAL